MTQASSTSMLKAKRAGYISEIGKYPMHDTEAQYIASVNLSTSDEGERRTVTTE